MGNNKKTDVMKYDYLSAFQWDLEFNPSRKLFERFMVAPQFTIEDYMGIELSGSAAGELTTLRNQYEANFGNVWDYGNAKTEIYKEPDYDVLKKDVLEKVFEDKAKKGDLVPTYAQIKAAEEARTSGKPMGAI